MGRTEIARTRRKSSELAHDARSRNERIKFGRKKAESIVIQTCITYIYGETINYLVSNRRDDQGTPRG